VKHQFFSDCVCWPRGKTNALNEMIDDARDITRRTFLKYVDREALQELEENLGYVTKPWEDGLRMASDWHVSYHKSRLNGFTVYYFRQSSIEYVFTPQDFTWRRAA